MHCRYWIQIRANDSSFYFQDFCFVNLRILLQPVMILHTTKCSLKTNTISTTERAFGSKKGRLSQPHQWRLTLRSIVWFHAMFKVTGLWYKYLGPEGHPWTVALMSLVRHGIFVFSCFGRALLFFLLVSCTSILPFLSPGVYFPI